MTRPVRRLSFDTTAGMPMTYIFDRKFGRQIIEEAPNTPAVYLFKDETDTVLYVGKAKNIRRRLQQYRNASRRKVHRKMRNLVREANTLEIRLQDSERSALLVENELIRELRPPYNRDGTFGFLYPAIGIGGNPKQALFGFTTQMEAWTDLDLRWYGVFKSRVRARSAFDALVYLLSLVGHIEKSDHLPEHKRLRGSRLTGFRRLSPELLTALGHYLSGDRTEALVPLAELLLEKPQARRDAGEVQANLKILSRFHRSDLFPLRRALTQAGLAATFVSQEQRDALFLASDDRYNDF